jgi:hypothetical protein
MGNKVDKRRGRPLGAYKVSKDLSADDICKIILTCKESGVSEISCLGIELVFHAPGQGHVIEPSKAVSQPEMASNPFPQEKQEAQLMNEQALDDAEEAQMLIDDPFAYERAQMLRDVERNRVHDGNKEV